MGIVENILLKLFRHVDIEKVIDGEKVVYLRRFYLIETKPVKVYLHIIKRSDDDPDPHDHPWDFTTLILKNGYHDNAYSMNAYGRQQVSVDTLSLLSVRRRKAEHVHKVILKAKDKPAWTIVLLGKYRRKWGFVKPDGRWIMWRQYLNYWGEDPYDKPELQ